MITVIRKSEATVRVVNDTKRAYNYITKDLFRHASLAVIEANILSESETTPYNRLYFVLSGSLILTVEGKEVTVLSEDSCFLSEGTTYHMSGTFKAIVINQPAFCTL